MGVFGAQLRPVGVQFLGDQHHQPGVDALAHFGFGQHHRDRVVGRQLDPAVQGQLTLLELQGVSTQLLTVAAGAADEQTTTSDGAGHQKRSTGDGHGVTSV